MIVYVIEKGQYSDRYVVGVVETEEEAKKICDTLNNLNNVRYYENDATYGAFDTKSFQTKQMRFRVEHEYDDWNVQYDDYDIYSEYKESCAIYKGFYIVYANSPAQAIKIAQDIEAKEYAIEKEVY